MHFPFHHTWLACLLLGMLASRPAAAQEPVSAALPIPPMPTPREKKVEKPDQTQEDAPSKPKNSPAAVSSIAPEEIEGFSGYPAPLQKLITEALALTKMNLRYTYGSSDPKSGGMDCSGTIYHLFHKLGVDSVPRQSDEVCVWAMKQSMLYRTENVDNLKDQAFSSLKPGDLLFWTGTYETAEPRALPVTHVMIYLGKRKENGKPVIFGASEGRTFDGQHRNGVSVFDFPLPKPEGKAEFYGYAPLPHAAWDEIRKTGNR